MGAFFVIKKIFSCVGERSLTIYIYKIVKMVENVACILWKIDIEKQKSTNETPLLGELISAFFLLIESFLIFSNYISGMIL